MTRSRDFLSLISSLLLVAALSISSRAQAVYGSVFGTVTDPQGARVVGAVVTVTDVTKNGGFRACESPDGRFIYYSKFADTSGLWRIPVEGGEESLILDQLQAGYWEAWAVVDRGIYFINPESKPHATIEFFSFATRRVTRIASLEKPVSILDISSLVISPDERWILYTQLDQSGSDIMLVENFR